jgi:RNA polymerase sigma-70 factor, ECF subfamily
VDEDSADNIGRWLSDARTGRDDALGNALDACRDYLMAVADREFDAGLRAKGGASDIVQETFLDAQRAFAQFHGTSEDELLAWLRHLLLNNLSDFRRRYRGTDKRNADREIQYDGSTSSRDWKALLAADGITPSAELVQQEDTHAIEDAIEHLPSDYRLVLQLRYVDDLSFEDIAKRLSRTSAATRKLFARAVECLQRALGEVE